MATPQHFQYKIENYIQARDRQNEKDNFCFNCMGFQPIWQQADFRQGVQLTCAAFLVWIFDTQNSGLVSSLGHLGANKPSWAKPDERRVALRRGYGALCANVFSQHSMGWYGVQSQHMDTTALVMWGPSTFN